MKLTKPFFAIFLFFSLYLPLAGQVSSFEEMEFESDSIRSSYKAAGKNYVFIRSKRGTSGVNKTPSADAILNSEVTEIVLVFSELNRDAISEREEANRERWENLLKTYPEFFQFSTTYKNVCQCNTNGDSAAFKKAQGFYVYVNGDVPKVEETSVAPPPPPAAKSVEKKIESAPPPTASPVEKAATKEVAVADKTSVKPKEAAPVVEKQIEKEPVKEIETQVSAPVQEESEVVKETPRRKPATTNKPRRAKDPKACRPPCYGFGDEDLVAFFKDNITLSKKQKRKAKNWVANVRLQINHDGSIKKSMVTGTETDFNKMVEDALKAMNNWNAAVKGGLAVKSEVRFNLKFDKSTKAMRPSDFMINPRPSPKCQCVSDSEIFGD